ncbi:MAG: hypothetical protein V2A79_03325 [Planctomycetota bacterium]
MMRSDDLLKRLEDRPFKPFRIHLSDGTRITVEEPGMVIVGVSTAVLPTKFRRSPERRRVAQDWRTVALLHIVSYSSPMRMAAPTAGGGKNHDGTSGGMVKRSAAMLCVTRASGGRKTQHARVPLKRP